MPNWSEGILKLRGNKEMKVLLYCTKVTPYLYHIGVEKLVEEIYDKFV